MKRIIRLIFNKNWIIILEISIKTSIIQGFSSNFTSFLKKYIVIFKSEAQHVLKMFYKIFSILPHSARDRVPDGEAMISLSH